MSSLVRRALSTLGASGSPDASCEVVAPVRSPRSASSPPAAAAPAEGPAAVGVVGPGVFCVGRYTFARTTSLLPFAQQWAPPTRHSPASLDNGGREIGLGHRHGEGSR